MGQLGQTITVINKSGVIVKNSKQVLSVFKEAKEAYKEKKAELRHAREYGEDERHVRKALNRMNLDEHDRASQAPSKASKKTSRHRSHAHHHRQRRSDEDSYYDHPAPRRSSADRLRMERGYSDPTGQDSARQPTHNHQISRKPVSRTHPSSPPTQDPHFQVSELRRRHTDPDPTVAHSRVRSRSLSPDMNLAYGELPPMLPARPQALGKEAQLRSKMTLLTRMLEEAHCVQHSATATIEHLQKNPDALAAVALTLAEISNLARKMAPGALASLAKSFPAAVALLASPQFLIATGLGVGVVVVALGGYKIVKRIQDQRAQEKEGRLLEMPAELDRIEMWRRGIADVESESVGTTVDGEFITPEAGRRLIEEGKIAPEELKAPEEGENEKRERRKSRRGNKMGQSSSTPVSEKRSGMKRKVVAKGVKMLFKGRST